MKWTLAEIANWLSIASFIISLVNFILILQIKGRIKRDTILNVTLVKLIERTKNHASAMSVALSIYVNSPNAFNEELSKCEATIQILNKRLGFFNAAFLKQIGKTIKTYKERGGRIEALARDVYSELLKAIALTEEFEESRRITSS